MSVQGCLSFLQITFSLNITCLISDLTTLTAMTVLIVLASIRKMHFTFYHIQIRKDPFYLWRRIFFPEGACYSEIVFYIAIERDLMTHL